MAAAERHIHHHTGIEVEGHKSSAFSISYTTRADAEKGIASSSLSLNLQEGSFLLKPELDGALHKLCNFLQIRVPHCEGDLPSFVRSCLYTLDEETGQDKPHFENEVIPVLFPNDDIAAHKVKKFLLTAKAPEKSDQCCEIKGTMDGQEQSIHLHGPYQGENKTRLTLLALAGYEPAQELLAKLVEAQPELRGKTFEEVAATIAYTISERRQEEIDSRNNCHHKNELQNHEGHVYALHCHEDHDEYQKLAEKIGSIINKGKFEDHPEVQKWWVNQTDDALTTTYASLKRNILSAEQPAKPLSDCGDVKFADTKEPLHFHSGIADWQKRRLLEVIAVWNSTPLEERTRESERIYQRAIAVVSVYFRGHAVFEPLERELREAKDEKVIAAVLDKMGATAISTVNALFPDKQIRVGHHEHEENHEQVEKLDWDKRLQIAAKIITSSTLHSNDPRLQEQFEKVAGKGFLGKIDLAEQLPGALVKQNKELTAQFVEILKASRTENPVLDVKTLILKLAQVHDPSINSADLGKYQEKNIQFTNQDAIKILALHLEILSRPEGMTISSEQFAQEQKIHELAKQLQSKGINFVNINADHSTAYHMELRPLIDKDGRPVMGPDGKSVIQMDLCPHSEQADQVLTETMQQVQQVEKVIQREIQTQKVSKDSFSQPHLNHLYPPPYYVGANNNHAGDIFTHNLDMGIPFEPTIGSVLNLSHSPSDSFRSDISGSGYISGHAYSFYSTSSEHNNNNNNRSSNNYIEPTRSKPVAENNSSQRVFITREEDSAPKPSLKFVRDFPAGGVDKALLRSVPTVSEDENASRTTAYLKKTNSVTPRPAKETPYVNRFSIGGATVNNAEATPVVYVSRKRSRVTNLNIPRNDTRLKLNRNNIPIADLSYPRFVRSNKLPESFISSFTISNLGFGSRNPSPTKPNPNRVVNSSESIGRSVSKPIEVPGTTIGANLSKAFEKVQKKEKVKATVSIKTAQNQQQEQVATALSGAKQEKRQKKVSKKIEAGESFGISSSSEVAEQSTNVSTVASLQEVYDKIDASKSASVPSQTRRTRGSSSDITEAALITEIETPKGKVKIIEGGRTAGVSANASQRTKANNAYSEDSITEVADGTDERNENAQATQAVSVQKLTIKPTATVSNISRVKQTGQNTASSMALSVNNEYLDFTNPHGIGDVFKQAWSRALAI